MAINDVECCDFYQVHENVVKAVNDKMPDEDKLYDLAEIFKDVYKRQAQRCLCPPDGYGALLSVPPEEHGRQF